MFSLGLCWLLSLFINGIMTAGTSSVVINGAVGKVPPIACANTVVKSNCKKEGLKLENAIS